MLLSTRHEQVHFITTYSRYFAEVLAIIDPKHFTELEIATNERLEATDRSDNQIKACVRILTT